MNARQLRFPLLAGLLLLVSAPLFAQTKYWVRFTDKPVAQTQGHQWVSDQTLTRRAQQGIALFQESDLPPNSAYLGAIDRLGGERLRSSKWLNATSAYLTPEQAQAAEALPFVLGVEPVGGYFLPARENLEPAAYTLPLEQIDGLAFTKAGLTGKGVRVGVIDAGFTRVDRLAEFDHLMRSGRIKAQRDFINPEREDLFGSMTRGDSHGRSVLAHIAGWTDSLGLLEGLAPDADFYLARTENGDIEHRVEEDDWISAMEWMDSLGVQVINTSLGYSQGMDDPNENYLTTEMDGQTAKISRAAQIAVEEKGLVLVVSAGNSGNEADWLIVSAPADAQGVFSIGATQKTHLLKIGYSSIGPEFLPYLKPNVSVYSPNGTSFSAPVMTGFVACLLQADPTKTNFELMRLIEQSSHLYPYGNNFLGYGVPSAIKALQLIKGEALDTSHVSTVVVKENKYVHVVKNPSVKSAEIFHKNGTHWVLEQRLVHSCKKRLFKKCPYDMRGNRAEDCGRKLTVTVARPSEGDRTTLHVDGDVVEILWK